MVHIYARDMLWYQNRLLMVFFDDAHFWPKMRMKINVVAKTQYGVYEYPQTKPKAPASSLGL